MTDKPSVIRETDEEARKLARLLLHGARFAALAVLDPGTGFPFASRVLLGTDIDGVPVILVSALSAHTKALSNDPRASLLCGEPAKGDPLAHPRLTVQCVAETVERNNAVHTRLRARFLSRHPKSKLYIDFPDFRFIRLVPHSASLNGGFGRAYSLPGSDLIFEPLPETDLSHSENDLLKRLESEHADRVTRIARGLVREKTGKKSGRWRVSGIDRQGFDLVSGDRLHRVDFDSPLSNYDGFILILSKIENRIPEI